MTDLSLMAGFVRRHDPDRFLATLFAPAERRETLLVLYAFNHELARAWEVTSQPTLSLIRLQWWREVLEGADRSHEVATPLRAELSAGRLDAATLLGLVDGRERVELGFQSASDWQAYLWATAGDLAVIAGRVLGGTEPTGARLRALGAAYGVAGQLRATGVWGGLVPARPAVEFAAPLTEWAHGLLGRPTRLPRTVVAAGLVGALARRDLRRPGKIPLRGLGDRAAVFVAAARGRV